MDTLFIDIGSNSIKSLLANIDADGRIVGLLESTAHNRISSGDKLKDDALQIILDSIITLSRAAREKSKDFELVCFGTSALRDSSNASEVLKALRARGIAVQVLSGKEEAELSFKGAISDESLQIGESQSVVFGDLGGGSMEFVSRKDSEIISVQSLPLGAVRLNSQFCTDSSLDLQKIKELCAQNLSRVILPKNDFKLVISGGAVTAARYILGGGKAMSKEIKISKSDLVDVLELSISLGAEGLSKKFSTPENRADILPAAFTCLIEVLNVFNKNEFFHTQRSLRYGFAENYYEF